MSEADSDGSCRKFGDAGSSAPRRHPGGCVTQEPNMPESGISQLPPRAGRTVEGARRAGVERLLVADGSRACGSVGKVRHGDPIMCRLTY